MKVEFPVLTFITNPLNGYFLAAVIAFFSLTAGCNGCSGGSSTTVQQDSSQSLSKATVVVTNSSDASLSISAELALTDEQRAQGLMNRMFMADDEGMLFIFQNEATRSFWMKNTLISLDMIFINSSGIIVDINKNAIPGNLIPYASSAPAKYVLEVNGGWCDENSVAKGNKVTIPAGY